MAWFEADEIKSRFNFSLEDDTDDAKVNFARELATSDLSDWLAADDLASAQSDVLPTDPTLLLKFNRTRNAHAFLTVYYVFLTNTQIKSSGTVKNQLDTNAQTITTAYLSPKDLEYLRELYLKQAKNLIAGFSVISFSSVVETNFSSDQFTSSVVAVNNGW